MEKRIYGKKVLAGGWVFAPLDGDGTPEIINSGLATNESRIGGVIMIVIIMF